MLDKTIAIAVLRMSVGYSKGINELLLAVKDLDAISLFQLHRPSEDSLVIILFSNDSLMTTCKRSFATQPKNVCLTWLRSIDNHDSLAVRHNVPFRDSF